MAFVEPFKAALGGSLGQEFFQRKTRVVAAELLGKVLFRRVQGKLMAGRVVETEAYLPKGDSACHAARKKTPRNEVMFEKGGVAYVYAIHSRWCFNVVTEGEDEGAAVLLRALEPLTGLDCMLNSRPVTDRHQLLNGPGKLCQAMSIDKSLNGVGLAPNEEIWFSEIQGAEPPTLKKTHRIGVTSAKKLKLRYVIQGSNYASGPRYLNR